MPRNPPTEQSPQARRLARAMEPYGPRISRSLRVEVDWSTYYGCGHFGCVFPTSDPRRVVKVTLDAVEGPIALLVSETGLDKKLDGLTRVELVRRISDAGPASEDAYVLLREDVEPLVARADRLGVDVNAWGQRRKWSADLFRAFEAMRYAVGAKPGPFGRDPEQGGGVEDSDALDAARASLERLQKFRQPRPFAEAVDQLIDDGIYLADAHPGNLGFRVHDWSRPGPLQAVGQLRLFRGGTPGLSPQRPLGPRDSMEAPLLLFDYGFSSSEETIEVPELETLEAAVQANPRLRAAARRIPSV